VAPTDTLTPAATEPAACTNDGVYVADVSVPDGTPFGSGETIEKTWRLRNTGTCSWGPSYQLQFISGEQMGGPDGQSVPDVAPGQTVEVTVPMVAPTSPGEHTGIWQMVGPDGQAFGGSGRWSALTVKLSVGK
jgi:hypothetical protein